MSRYDPSARIPPSNMSAYVGSTPKAPLDPGTVEFVKGKPPIVQTAKDWRYYETTITHMHEVEGAVLKEYKEGGSWKEHYKTWRDACVPLGKSKRQIDRLIQEEDESRTECPTEPLSETATTLATVNELPDPFDLMPPTVHAGAAPRPATPQPVPKAEPQDTTPRDLIGYPIPAQLMERWNQRQEVQDRITAASRLRCALEEIANKGHRNPLYGLYDWQGLIRTISELQFHLGQCKPEVICYECDGHFSKRKPTKGGDGITWHCAACYDRGFITHKQWDDFADSKLALIQEKVEARLAKCKTQWGLTMLLRPYQQAAREAAHEKWKAHRSTIIVMATGLGKSTTLAFIIKDFLPKRSLVITHRRELIWQLRDEIESVTKLRCAIEMGDVFSDETLFEKSEVVIATVQTLSRRLSKFRPEEFGLLVYDEAHHSVAPVNRKVVEHFCANPELKLLLTTATPERADEEALSQVCESEAFNYGIFDGVQDGWLVDISAQFCQVKQLDLSQVHTTAGDLNQGELGQIMERDEIIMGVAQPIVEVTYGLQEHTLDGIAPGGWQEYLAALNRTPRPGLVFTVTVDQAEGLAKLLRMAHPKLAESVHAKTEANDRVDIFQRLKTGETSLIVNVGICTEGYNNPRVQTIFIARPTKSRCLYMQMIGRSTRPLPGLVDGLATAEERQAAIAASDKPWARLVDFAGNTGRHDLVSPWNILGGHVTDEVVARAIKKAKEEGRPVRVIANLNNTDKQLKAEAKEEEAARVLARSKFHMGQVDLKGGGRGSHWQPNHTPSKPASEPQRRCLGRAGVHPDWWTKKQASWIIGKLVENHWRLPADMDFLKRPKHQKAA